MSSTPTEAGNKGPWRTGLLAGMASYLDAGAIQTTAIALVLYAPTFNLDDGAIGTLSGLLTLFFALGSVVGGWLGDRFGRRRVFTMSLVLYAVGIAGLMTAVNPLMLYIAVVLTGIAIGADLPVSLALMAEESPEGMKGRMVAFSGVLWIVGLVFTGILTAVVGSLGVLGARILYGHLLLVSVVVLALRLRLPESREWVAAQRANSEGDDEIRFSAIPQLFAPPLLFAVLALGLYYAVWNLAANTLGQFSAFIWVNLAGSTVETQALVGLSAVPVAVGASLFFMRVVDGPTRLRWFAIGAISTAAAFGLIAVVGVSVPALVVCQLLFAFGAAFAGETIYKVWSQELVPTLLRGTAQGLTLAFARLLAALFAFVTPSLLTANSRLTFGLLFAFTVVSGAVGLLWVPRLSKAAELEPAEVTLVTKAGPI
ncbi:MAG TPA: MFS transporter [Roseiflexaceae bacterium]|nr:MFS transporter [Roseiflexaceae bacterium]